MILSNPKYTRVFTVLLLALSLLACVRAMAATTNRQAQDNSIAIDVSAPRASSNDTTLQLTLPQAANPSTVHVVLNGKDITSRVGQTTCPQGLCMSGSISQADGLRAGKNVVYATAHSEDGRSMSGRIRFAAGGSQLAPVSSMSQGRLHGAANLGAADVSDSPGFLLPTITFQTLNGGGWTQNAPWLQVGSSTYPASGVSCSGSTYLLLVFDRQTLQPLSGAPAPCVANGTALTADFTSIEKQAPGALAVVGTLYNQAADSTLDTSLIGGSNHTKDNPAVVRYIAIGVVGAAPGTAFENFTLQVSQSDTRYTPMYPFATGVVQEDENGDYDFESSDVLEYTVDTSPTDSASGPGPITIGAFQATTQQNPSFLGYRFTAPSVNSGRGGYWLLIVQRDSPWAPIKSPNTCATGAVGSDGLEPITNCGGIYPTGDTSDTSGGTRKKAYQDLANALNAIGPYDLAFLTTWGSPNCCGNYWDVTGNGSSTSNGFLEFRDALESLDGSGRAPLFGNNINQQAFTFITSRGMGDPLMGSSAISSTSYSDSGQAGYLHGTLARNLNGLYQPYQSSQQLSAADDQTAGPDFTLTKMATLQPVAWPELSGTTIPGATNPAGQEAAYHYASYTLITQYYIKGASGDYLDDIHYFFTGSNSNYINYHYFDPVSLPWPGGTATSYTWVDPVTNQSLTFTQNDFTAVTAQVSKEVVDLTNVLNFMVTGPVNMKDMIASGNANAGLALTGAAANVLSSSLNTAVTKSTAVKLNLGNVLSLLSGVASVAAAVASDGTTPILGTITRGDINFTSSLLGGLLSGSGAYFAGLRTSGPETLPSRYGSFATTIGQLADSDLQGQLSIGFDTALDSILADWGKLHALGPKITDTSLPGFYSPNQVAQNAAVQMLTLASERSFYLSLVPTVYRLDFWPDANGNSPTSNISNQPDMGSFHRETVGADKCDPFYMQGSSGNGSATAPAYSFIGAPTPGGAPSANWGNEEQSSTPSDFYIVRGDISNRATTSTQFAWMDQGLAQELFSPAGLNIPLDLFVSRTGPLASEFNDMSAMADSTHLVLNNITGFSPDQVCAARTAGVAVGVSSDPPGGPTPTTTTLTVPAASVLGEPLTLTATVAAGSTPVTTGSVIFVEGSTTVGTSPLDAAGTAATTLSNPALGQHSYQALYSLVEPYDASASDMSTVMVYANAPNLSLSLSAANLSVAYGSTSSPITIKSQSLSGMTGTIAFSCSGLPVGMTCIFNPAQEALAVGSSASTSVTIKSSPATQAASVFTSGTRMIFLLPVSILMLFGLRKGRRNFERLLCLGIFLAISSMLVACSGSSSSSKPVQETGSRTILVNATCGTVTQSAPLVLNIQ